MIPCSSPLAHYEAQRAEIDAAIRRALESGWYIHGEEGKAFEREFAAYIGGRECIGVGSGTEAIHVALAACGVGAGDEVVTVAHTAVATVSAIELTGARAVFADIEPDYYTIDPAKLEAALTPKTKAIIVVHIYGQPADLTRLQAIAKARGIKLIEDCAQSHGAYYGKARAGSIGDVACFSFYPTKNLGAIGDGGAIVTNDAEIANRARLLREYGWKTRYVSDIAGWNSRLDEVQAALLRVRLTHLDADNAQRVKIAGQYDAKLPSVGITPPARRSGSTHVYHLYVIRHPERDRLLEFLKGKGVGTMIHYPMPIHLQPAYQGRVGVPKGGLPETERAAREVLSLPMYPELPEGAVDTVVNAIAAFSPASAPRSMARA